MPKGVAVFDLDNTIGDFSSIDFFSSIYDIPSLFNNSGISVQNKLKLKFEYEKYSPKTKEFLKELRDTFETALDKEGYTEMILRPDIDSVIAKLVEQIDKKSLAGCLIYSNNGNPYTLEFAGRAFERAFERKDIFFGYLDRTNNLRNEFDGPAVGSRLKTVATIQKVAKELRNISDIEPSDIIFFDDLIHSDLMDKGVTYVHVKQFHSNIHQEKLHEIFALFESTLYDLFAKYKFGAQFFNMYHLKNLFKIYSIEEMEERYVEHSRTPYTHHFVSDYPEIKDKLDTYIESIQKYVNISGGKRRRTYKRKLTKKSVKKNRTRY